MSSEVITRNDLKNILNSVLPIFYPVGSYYETSDTTFNPNTEWGGTWELETAGQVHVSAGGSYSVDGALTNTSDGGASTVKLTDEQMAHGHGFTQPKIPAHKHSMGKIWSDGTGSSQAYQMSNNRTLSTRNTNGNVADGGGGACTGGAVSNLHGASSTRTAHNNMQPYIVVNRWHRTA